MEKRTQKKLAKIARGCLQEVLRETVEVIRNQKNYNLHRVPVNGITYLVADARAMNKARNQSGRGCYRYLFDLNTQEFMGIGEEQDRGHYRKVA